jgi:glycosyltransferase involved in cell wall biosynthesis
MENKLPSVSIIVPIYNVEKYIARCLYSVMSQDYQGELECVLVNDCTPDNSMLIVHELLSDYDGTVKFTICNHEHNRGLSAARNTGMDNSSGDYIFFLDSDDELSTDAISSLVSLVVKYNNVDIVYGDWYTSRRHDSLQNRQEIKELVNDRKQICNLLLSMKISMTGVNKLIQRKYLQRNSLYFREGILHEDNLFTYYLAISARRIAISHTPSYVYFNNPGSITNSVSTKHAESCLEIASQILDDKNDFMNRQKYRYCKCLIDSALLYYDESKNIHDEIVFLSSSITKECFHHKYYLLGTLYFIYYRVVFRGSNIILKYIAILCSKTIGLVTQFSKN